MKTCRLSASVVRSCICLRLTENKVLLSNICAFFCQSSFSFHTGSCLSHDSQLNTDRRSDSVNNRSSHSDGRHIHRRQHTAFTIPGLWAPTCRCFRVNIDGNVSAPPPLLSGSLAPDTDCRIRCVSERIDAAEVSRTTAADGTRVPLQESGSTGIRFAGSVVILPPRGDVLVRLCLQTEQTVSLMTSEQVPAQDTFTPHTYRTHERF